MMVPVTRSAFYGIPERECIITSRELNGGRPVERPQDHFQLTPWRWTNSVMKRTLRRNEWPKNPLDWYGPRIAPAANYPAKWQNDRATLRWLWKNTYVPVPEHHYTFEDVGTVVHMVERFRGAVKLKDLPEHKKEIVKAEVTRIMDAMKELKTSLPGGMAKTMLLAAPDWASKGEWKKDSVWKVREDVQEEEGAYVFCHANLTQDFVLVDEKRCEVLAITDWDSAGYWPAWMEKKLWEDEKITEADVQKCRDWLQDNCDEVVMEHLPEPNWRATGW